MKKILISILLTILTIPTFAQKYEISFQYSQLSIPQTVYVVGGAMGVVFTLRHFSFTNTVATGALALEYIEQTDVDWLKVGLLTCGEYMTSDTIDQEGNTTGKYNMGVISLMGTAHFKWFTRDKFRLYSKIGVGASTFITDEAIAIPAFQVSPICIDFGTSSLRGLVEIGVGMQGLITGGIKKVF